MGVRLLIATLVTLLAGASALIPSIWPLVDASSGRRKLTVAGIICIIVFLTIAALTLGQVLADEFTRQRDDRTAAVERERVTREIIVSGQPLNRA